MLNKVNGDKVVALMAEAIAKNGWEYSPEYIPQVMASLPNEYQTMSVYMLVSGLMNG